MNGAMCLLSLIDMTDREWENTIGTSYSPTEFMNFSYHSVSDRQLTGSKGYYNSQDVTFTLKPKWVEPYVKYTFGQNALAQETYFVSDGSVELGLTCVFSLPFRVVALSFTDFFSKGAFWFSCAL
ncbi:hypothetical protein OK016_29295 [Vibrio chagasii]|nr:hypothetical protein [Vibrio chagasii]